MPTSSVVSQGDLAVADHINNIRTDVLSTHTHDGTDGNATIEATSFTGTATYTGASLTFGDEDLLRWGTNADIVSLNRSTALSADTELTGIIEGTSDHPGVAANSLIISNITDDGDIMFVVSDGGNSKGLLKLDGANGKVTIHGGDLEVAEALTVTGATTLNGNVTLGDAASDVITVNGTLAGASALVFEGATADGYETTLAYTDPTADRTITFPNLSGTVVLGGVDNGALAITTTGLVTAGSLDIDNVLINGTTIGHTDDTDLITVANGALTIAGTIGSGAITSTGIVTGTGFTAGSAVLAEAELELLDGLTAGTAIASKVVTTDANIDTSGQRNLTITGELDAATLDISGNADIAGDLTLSAGTDGALRFSAASSIKILDNSGTSLVIEEADTAYMTFVTTDSSEAVSIAKTLTLGTVAAAGTDTDKFLVLDSSGNVDYRTGTEVLSDIGGGTGSGDITGVTAGVGLSGGGSSGGVTLTLDLSELSTVTPADGDFFSTLDSDGANEQKTTTTALATLFAGTGLTASSSVIGVDAAQTQITSLGSQAAAFTVGVDDTGYDVTFFGDTASRYWLWDTSADGVVQRGTLTVGVDDTGHDVKFFGASAGAYMEWDESLNLLELRGATAAGPGHLKLTTGEATVVASDVLGKIEFQAPAETGTDALTVAASIQAVAQDTFSATVNATDLIFYTGHSEAAAEKFRFTYQGELGVGGANYGTDGQVLTSTGAGTAPAWEDAGGGLEANDIIVLTEVMMYS